MFQVNKRIAPFRSKTIIRAFAILMVIVFAGTGGYMIIERWGFLDALYMTVITITTVGFKEVREVSEAGRIFTIFIIFSGMGIIAYVLGIVAQAMVEFQMSTLIGRTKLGLRMRSIKNHFIVCGFGRIGRIICRELKAHNVPMVVIDNRPEARQALENEDIPFIIDDATNEEVLLEAGIKRAKGLVSVVASDADNLFITMSARGLNPSLFILARAEEEQTEKKLKRAGADRVGMPYLIGGQKMAHILTRPAVTDFLEFTVHNRDMGLEMGELEVGEESQLNGLTLVESDIRKDMNVIIVAIRKKGGEMKFNPSSETHIRAGDTLIALGKSEELEKLSRILAG
ncbi:MAG: potassium channel protein [Deltaproteobacteria bacterium]|nr:potassium channel protein [Deltaproteobacteria bacterium]MBW2128478.1 potassium channel protein [Deltaproteobacteria bacterium]MBW2303663.1 potassium channel protein [Deltaproteobacteria bacterium]